MKKFLCVAFAFAAFALPAKACHTSYGFGFGSYAAPVALAPVYTPQVATFATFVPAVPVQALPIAVAPPVVAAPYSAAPVAVATAPIVVATPLLFATPSYGVGVVDYGVAYQHRYQNHGFHAGRRK